MSNRERRAGGEEALKEMKRQYESVEVPAELALRIQKAVEQAEAALSAESKGEAKTERDKEGITMKNNRGKRSYGKVWGSIAALLAVCVLALGIGVNTSPAFAASVDDIPLIGDIARILTVKTVQEETDAYVTDLEIPGIEGLADKELQAEINRLVSEQVDAAVEEAKVMMEEYKEAYLATGGTEEDYTPMVIDVDYLVYCVSEDILSFGVFKTDTLASAYAESFYHNYDLRESRELTLPDLLGPDYVAIANEQIAAEMQRRVQEEEAMYFDGSDGFEGFSSIAEDQQFYVNEAGNPVVVFNKYDIAPGYMGVQTFEIIK